MAEFGRALEMAWPPRIKFGPGLVHAVGDWVKTQSFARPLVVSDPFNARRIAQLDLPVQPVVFSDLKGEPTTAELDAVLAIARETRPDVVVGFGGGSAMDLAKLVVALLDGKQTLGEIIGLNKVAGRSAQLVQVPTTSGTGSEVGARALVIDAETQNKVAVDSPWMIADLAVVDPDLTLTIPPHVTAATGVDAMAHCVEAFTSRKAHPLIDTYAADGIRLVGRYLKRAVEDGRDQEARAGLSLASLYGGFCLCPVNTTAGHAIAYPLGVRHHIAHGTANAVIFPHTLAANAASCVEKTEFIVQALDSISAGRSTFDVAFAFCAGLGIEMTLSRLGVPESDLDRMAQDAFGIRRLLDNNPRDLGRDDILAIYRAAY